MNSVGRRNSTRVDEERKGTSLVGDKNKFKARTLVVRGEKILLYNKRLTLSMSYEYEEESKEGRN